MSIHKKIVNIIQSVGAIDNTRKSATAGYAYRSIDDVIVALRAHVQRERIYILPTNITEYYAEEGKSKSGLPVRICRFVQHFKVIDADSETYIETAIATEGMDASATDKATAIARSYALKSLLCTLFFVATHEALPDPEHIDVEVQAQKKPPTLPSPPKPTPKVLEEKSTSVSPIKSDEPFHCITQFEKSLLMSTIKEECTVQGLEFTNTLAKAVYDNIVGKTTVNGLKSFVHDFLANMQEDLQKC